MNVSTIEHAHSDRYRHEAMFYEGHNQFIEGTLDFIRGAIGAEEPILVVLDMPKIEALIGELDGDAEHVVFADMSQVGDNPARIIPAWQRFVAEHSRLGRRLRGIGEPISAARTSPELVECERHEALLNVAFAGTDFWLLCPYDIASLDDATLAGAHRNHPFVRVDDIPMASTTFPGSDILARPFDDPLSDPPPRADTLLFDETALKDVRVFVSERGARAGLAENRAADLILAVHEVATNSIRHANGRGTLRVWQEGGAVVCEIRDTGRILDPLVGRTHPRPDAEGGRGLWLANQLCELVQIRTFPTETAVRLRMRVT